MALGLALDGELLPERVASLTGAPALRDVLVERLRTAGPTYEVTGSDSPAVRLRARQ